jgi:hypothetical protein
VEEKDDGSAMVKPLSIEERLRLRRVPSVEEAVYVCERHPWLRWPQEDGECAGPGVLVETERCGGEG